MNQKPDRHRLSEAEIQYIKKQAEAGIPEALFIFAKLSESSSIPDAIKSYTKLGEMHIPQAWSLLGDLYTSQNMKSEALETYKKALDGHMNLAKNGNVHSLTMLEELWEKDLGHAKDLIKDPQKDLKDHFNHCRNNANTPHEKYLIGKLYEDGIIVKSSLDNAFHYYKLAADGGDHLAQHRLATFYLDNKDANNAIIYLRLLGNGNSKAAPALKAYSAYHLACLYEEGKEIRQSFSDAVKYYSLASSNGESNASYRLGKAYLTGELGLEKSEKDAFEHFKRSYEQGYKNAAYDLGLCYENGKGIEKSLEKAIEYFEELPHDPECEKKLHH